MASQQSQDAPVPVRNGDHNDGIPTQSATQNGLGSQATSTSDDIQVQCGPLLNFKRMSEELSDTPIWHGSVLIATNPGQKQPKLSLHCIGPVAEGSGQSASQGSTTYSGIKLYSDPKKEFWRFEIECPFQAFEAKWEYSIAGLRYVDAQKQATPQVFVVPSKAQSMRILFHSCNGFSVGTDTAAWNGAALWNDVLRMHDDTPFHVMIGGGDQIYNDSVRVKGPLKAWTEIGNPKKRRDYPFPPKMRAECDDYYYDNYVEWYGSEPFSTANAQIPQINIWDDHDIIDGFGSYTDHFMRCAVFRGIGGVAHKYYMLFQHHVAPPKTTFATGVDKTHGDELQLKDTFVLEEARVDPSFIVGSKPGPYVEEKSNSLYCQLGARIAFFGIDARTERTRHQINYPETYELVFNRVNAELSRNKNLKHLILLLGVPIAYPRLQWLENILSSPIIGPIRFLNKRFGLAGGLFNKFDGGVDLLDDLDDHYTARQHKHERRDLIQKLQALSKERSVRITILGGDVHLAAVGRFYSNPKHNIPAEQDWRYMPNIVSSAITNKPPPQAVANLLARRNKIHHLDHDTDETLLEIFNRDPGLENGSLSQAGTAAVDGMSNGNGSANGSATNGDIKAKTSAANHATMPSRNYAIIAESHMAEQIVAGNVAPADTNGHASPAEIATANGDAKLNPRRALHEGEQKAGTDHPAAGGLTKTGLCGQYGLDVTLRVEVSPKDAEGHTDGYGLSIPALDTSSYAQHGTTW